MDGSRTSLPRRRACFVSRRLVCLARAIEPTQKLQRALPGRSRFGSTLWNPFTDIVSILLSFLYRVCPRCFQYELITGGLGDGG